MSATVWFTSWKSGPAGGPSAGGPGGGAALVSVTEFTPRRPWSAPGVAMAGMALRRVWDGLDGAVGLWLWVDPDPLRPRSGSVSVWRAERDLYAFVARPDHARIVRSHRDRGSMRSTTWTTGSFDPDATREAARSLLSGRSAWPVRRRERGPEAAAVPGLPSCGAARAAARPDAETGWPGPPPAG
ncbi:hypothetical protein E6R60_23595 [Streptomyces sp. A0642]|uniref:hypothetical protein n=1 Tax=Streptomyces sp. A0642 TaxID=2563100 RepID=UPI0010A20C1A|nr:hypothetical protein [Streptomyces sp. A0642]THA73609.1 hypothetical protein E6R60_23595 [Streptomyces sp. A0642]